MSGPMGNLVNTRLACGPASETNRGLAAGVEMVAGVGDLHDFPFMSGMSKPMEHVANSAAHNRSTARAASPNR